MTVATAAASVFAGEQPDGTDWGRMGRADKITWVRGWMDGMNTGTAYAAGANTLLEKFKGMSVEEMVKGMDQFYAADYRNTPISMGLAALVVAEYSRGGLDSEGAIAMIEKLRDASH